MGERLPLNINAERKYFFGKSIFIALPVMLQNLIAVGLNIIDSIMIGGLGEAAMAGVGAANQIYMIYSEVCFGTFSGAAVYVSQFWGIRDRSTVRKVLGIDFSVAIVSAAVFVLGIQFTAPHLIWLFSQDANVIDLGTQYIQVAKYSYILVGITFCLNYNCRIVQKLVLPTIISASALGVNTLFNWFLIYGKCGFPELGVQGAGYATIIARVLELIGMFACVYLQKDHPLRASLKELLSFDRKLFGDVIRLALPACGTEVGWAVCVSFVYMAYGKISAESLAVVSVTEVVACFFQCIFFGLGNATGFIIGDCLGRGETERSYYFARLSLKITWFLNVLMTVAMLLIRPFIIQFYNFTPETIDLLYVALAVWAFTITPKMLGYVMICGFLRTGGDTLFAFKIDFSMNILQVGLAFFGVLVMHWSLPAIVAFTCLSEVGKCIMGYMRLYSRKWINIVTDAA